MFLAQNRLQEGESGRQKKTDSQSPKLSIHEFRSNFVTEGAQGGCSLV